MNRVMILALAAMVACNGDTTDKTDTTDATDTTDTTDATSGDTGKTAPATFNLTLTGTGYTPHVGQTMSAAVVDAKGTAVATDSFVVPKDGTIDYTFKDAVTEGETYTLYWYTDHNSNKACDAPPTDHGWSSAVAAVTADVTVDYPHDTNFDKTVCDHF